MPATLSCPQCGAPAPAGAESTRCDYCGSALATVSCPACFEAMFVGMQFCPHCGSKSAREIVDDSRSLPCPGCKSEMRAVRVGTAVMYECESCASNWLDTDAFTELCTNREERGAVAAIVGSSKGATANVPSGPIRYLPCPTCKKLMNRTNFGHKSGVIIDVCKGHGAWFEPRELAKVLAFVDSGGFERARAEDIKRRIDEQRSLERTVGEAVGPNSTHVFFAVREDTAAVDDSMLRRALEHLLF